MENTLHIKTNARASEFKKTSTNHMCFRSTHLSSVVREFNLNSNFTLPWPHHKVGGMFLKNFILNRDEPVKSTEAMQRRNGNKPEDYPTSER